MAVFSTLEIEFLIDFEEGYELRMGTIENEVVTTYSFDWVVTRSAAFEVTTGTPTGNAGETTATNFEAAYDLDFPTDFITTRTVNSLLIESETEGLNFTRFAILNDEGDFLDRGTDYNVTYNNYIEPVDFSNIEFALVKSPHYVNIPFYSETTTSTTLELFVWNGALASVPATPTNTLTIPRPSTNFEEFNVDLSELIAQRLNPVPVIDLTSTVQTVDSTDDSVKWIQYNASYTDPDESIADIEGTFVGVDGYGYYNEGVNPTKPTNNILTNCFNRKVSRDKFIMLPFVNNGTIVTIDVLSETGEINDTLTITPSDNSTDMVQYVEVDLTATTTDEYITITTKPDSDVVVYEIIDECRYNPVHVIFKNKYGVYENATLFKKSTTSISTTNDFFVNNYVSSGVYDTTKHQNQKINIQGEETISVNSGYIKETENSLYKEMLLSETVFFYENDSLVPVNVSSSSLEFKTRINDSLVNYKIDFKYAYNLIQNV